VQLGGPLGRYGGGVAALWGFDLCNVCGFCFSFKGHL